MGVWVHPAIQAAYFGSSVALSADGNTLFASAPFETASPTQRRLGAVYVYTLRPTVLLWDLQARLVGRNSEQFDNFGGQISVSSDGNTLAVSAIAERGSGGGVTQPGPTPDDDDDGLPDAGAVYVFMREAAVWSQHAYVKPSNPDASDVFGTAVALSADGRMLAVGAMGEASRAAGVGGDESDNDAADAGAAYVFQLSDGQWSQRSYVKAANPQSADQFGSAVALSGDGNVLAVGAPLEDGKSLTLGGADNNDATDAGAVYLY